MNQKIWSESPQKEHMKTLGNTDYYAHQELHHTLVICVLKINHEHICQMSFTEFHQNTCVCNTIANISTVYIKAISDRYSSDSS